MKCISLWQPWASAIALGHKKIETRHWRVPHDLIGERICIHAAKRQIKNREWVDFHRNAVAWGWLNNPPIASQLPYGAIVATAVLSECKRTEDIDISIDEIAADAPYGDFSDGRYGWFLTDIGSCNPPIPFRGSQGFFNVPFSFAASAEEKDNDK